MEWQKKRQSFSFAIPECSLSYQEIVQMSGMTKEKTKFFFCHSRVQPILFKDSANEWNGKRKDEVFLFHSRVQPILFKDSANEWNDKRKDEVFLFLSRVQPILSRDSANEWNGKTLENLLFLRDL